MVKKVPENNKVSVNKKYKDTVFRMLFKDKKHLLELYNGINGTNYKNEKELRINILENAVYMNMKNDVSYVFRFEMTLYEHQSTLCPNMPLRDLFYVSRLLESELEQCKTLREYSMFVDLIRKNIVMSNKIDKNVIFV